MHTMKINPKALGSLWVMYILYHWLFLPAVKLLWTDFIMTTLFKTDYLTAHGVMYMCLGLKLTEKHWHPSRNFSSLRLSVYTQYAHKNRDQSLIIARYLILYTNFNLSITIRPSSCYTVCLLCVPCYDDVWCVLCPDHHRKPRLHGTAVGPGCWQVASHTHQS